MHSVNLHFTPLIPQWHKAGWEEQRAGLGNVYWDEWYIREKEKITKMRKGQLLSDKSLVTGHKPGSKLKLLDFSLTREREDKNWRKRRKRITLGESLVKKLRTFNSICFPWPYSSNHRKFSEFNKTNCIFCIAFIIYRIYKEGYAVIFGGF